MTPLLSIYEKSNIACPEALNDWEAHVDIWCDEYKAKSKGAYLTVITIDQAVFVFDLIFERVVIAYSSSNKPLCVRDASRIRGFPDVNASTQSDSREHKFESDKGHFLGHASGGELDINLFPHRRELNRGWSEEGKIFRAMERYVSDNIGTFFYHRAVYNDDTWVPSHLEYGVLKAQKDWWIGYFVNSGVSNG